MAVKKATTTVARVQKNLRTPPPPPLRSNPPIAAQPVRRAAPAPVVARPAPAPIQRAPAPVVPPRAQPQPVVRQQPQPVPRPQPRTVTPPPPPRPQPVARAQPQPRPPVSTPRPGGEVLRGGQPVMLDNRQGSGGYMSGGRGGRSNPIFEGPVPTPEEQRANLMQRYQEEQEAQMQQRLDRLTPEQRAQIGQPPVPDPKTGLLPGQGISGGPVISPPDLIQLYRDMPPGIGIGPGPIGYPIGFPGGQPGQTPPRRVSDYQPEGIGTYHLGVQDAAQKAAIMDEMRRTGINIVNPREVQDELFMAKLTPEQYQTFYGDPRFKFVERDMYEMGLVPQLPDGRSQMIGPPSGAGAFNQPGMTPGGMVPRHRVVDADTLQPLPGPQVQPPQFTAQAAPDPLASQMSQYLGIAQNFNK